ncbi:MAG: hypothetical protein ACXWYM_00055 [Candidatus Binatia bacterium]
MRGKNLKESDYLTIIKLIAQGFTYEGAGKQAGVTYKAVLSRMTTLKIREKDIRRMAREGKTAEEILATSPMFAVTAPPPPSASVAAPSNNGGAMLSQEDLLQIRDIVRDEIIRWERGEYRDLTLTNQRSA